MGTAFTNPQKEKKETTFPPKRGQIKARIFESMAKTVVFAISKTRKKNKGEGSDYEKISSSEATTPPLSGYNSEGNGDLS